MSKKTALVTGAASGIGLAVCESLATEELNIVMVDVNEEALQAHSARLGASYFKADLSTREGCKSAVEFTAEKFGGVDILVNVAGVQNVCAIDEFPEDKWDFMINLMLTAPFLLTKYSWKYMKANKWGRIINLNSIHGLVASDYKSAYVSAKHGLSGLTKVAALEGGEFGITVNSICPAYVRTPLVDKQIADQARNHGISEEEVISKIMLSKAAVKRMIEPKELGDFVKFLCSESATSISGATLTMDGGWTAG